MTRVALVTGAARGIGAATVHALVADGWSVVAVDRGSDDPRIPYAAGTLEQLQALRSDAVLPVVADTSDAAGLAEAVAVAERELGGLDAAIAVAGVVAGGVPLWEQPEEQVRAVLDVDLYGVVALARVAVPALLRRPEPRSGRFLAVASAAATRGLPMLGRLLRGEGRRHRAGARPRGRARRHRRHRQRRESPGRPTPRCWPRAPGSTGCPPPSSSRTSSRSPAARPRGGGGGAGVAGRPARRRRHRRGAAGRRRARALTRDGGPLPPLALDRDVRVLAAGRVLLGGDPPRLLRLRTAVPLERLAAGDAADAPTRALARTLLDGGLVHPRPTPAPHAELEVVIPVRDRPEQLAACLAALGGGVPVLVVDDASLDPDAVAEVCRRAGARVLRLTTNAGPAGARNAGLAATSAAVVALLDSDCLPPPGWIACLAGHSSTPAWPRSRRG
jgi:NAD(P)-dependent dehydrogenase (short-subunit alcohol dehydrogenase family)